MIQWANLLKFSLGCCGMPLLIFIVLVVLLHEKAISRVVVRIIAIVILVANIAVYLLMFPIFLVASALNNGNLWAVVLMMPEDGFWGDLLFIFITGTFVIWPLMVILIVITFKKPKELKF